MNGAISLRIEDLPPSTAIVHQYFDKLIEKELKINALKTQMFISILCMQQWKLIDRWWNEAEFRVFFAENIPKNCHMQIENLMKYAIKLYIMLVDNLQIFT